MFTTATVHSARGLAKSIPLLLGWVLIVVCYNLKMCFQEIKAPDLELRQEYFKILIIRIYCLSSEIFTK